MSKKEAPVFGRQILNSPGEPGFWVASSTMSRPKRGRLERLKPEASSELVRSCAKRRWAASKGIPRSRVRSCRMVGWWLRASTHSTCRDGSMWGMRG